MHAYIFNAMTSKACSIWQRTRHRASHGLERAAQCPTNAEVFNGDVCLENMRALLVAGKLRNFAALYKAVVGFGQLIGALFHGGHALTHALHTLAYNAQLAAAKKGHFNHSGIPFPCIAWEWEPRPASSALELSLEDHGDNNRGEEVLATHGDVGATVAGAVAAARTASSRERLATAASTRDDSTQGDSAHGGECAGETAIQRQENTEVGEGKGNAEEGPRHATGVGERVADEEGTDATTQRYKKKRRKLVDYHDMLKQKYVPFKVALFSSSTNLVVQGATDTASPQQAESRDGEAMPASRIDDTIILLQRVVNYPLLTSEDKVVRNLHTGEMVQELEEHLGLLKAHAWRRAAAKRCCAEPWRIGSVQSRKAPSTSKFKTTLM